MAIIGYAGNSLPQSQLFTPEKWSRKTLAIEKRKTVFEKITNKDYEGEIKNEGDTVNIARDIVPVAKGYQRGMPLEFEQQPTISTQLVINRAAYIGNYVELVSDYQSALNRMNIWAMNAGYAFSVYKDKQILNEIHLDADPMNRGATAGAVSADINLGATGSPLAIDVTNVIDVIEDAGEVLRQADVDSEDTFIVVPTWMGTLLKKAMNSRGFYEKATMVLENGELPFKIDGFKVYESNNYEYVVDGGVKAYNIIFGRKSATTLAEQLTKTQEMEAVKEGFGTFRKQLMVWGIKVLQPKEIGVIYAYKA